ncbi:hypothetical protein C8F01DRAFT_1373665 [Mycena amicta]|nr:hypothetical protein C8F01DRAFT_1373665 [Mycena amicta]
MDSQLTLVHHPTELRLVFARDDVKNTSIAIDGAPAYTVRTPLDSMTTEIIAAGSMVALARVVRREIFPNTVAFAVSGGILGHEVRLDKWLRKGKMADKSTAYFLQINDERLVLRRHPQYRLALSAPENDSQDIARWDRPTVLSPPTLVLKSTDNASEAHRIQILTAFLVVELAMRLKEQAGGVSLGLPRIQ